VRLYTVDEVEGWGATGRRQPKPPTIPDSIVRAIYTAHGSTDQIARDFGLNAGTVGNIRCANGARYERLTAGLVRGLRTHALPRPASAPTSAPTADTALLTTPASATPFQRALIEKLNGIRLARQPHEEEAAQAALWRLLRQDMAWAGPPPQRPEPE
jgi:hypothetical protein